MRCLPKEKLALAKGNVLHDWHAEVLAIRAFNRFLVDECADLARKGFVTESDGGWVGWRKHTTASDPNSEYCDGDDGRVEDSRAPFELADDVGIHMYCSEAPCGDASMELTMAEQEDDTPWTSSHDVGGMLGREHFDQLGIVRRKPSRADAPVTWSKSCSDKLAMKQCTGLLSSLTSMIIGHEKAYLDTLVLPESQYVEQACRRAFSADGRMAPLLQDSRAHAGGYEFKPFQVETTSKAFEYSKRCAGGRDAVVPTNISMLYTPRRQEVLINGVLQGRKQFDPQGGSCASRRRMWRCVVEFARLARLPKDMGRSSYRQMKEAEQLKGRTKIKNDVRERALKGWKRNLGDEDWCLS